MQPDDNPPRRRFAGKSALVTGAQQGIGAGAALAFAREGAAVAVNWFDNEKAAEAVLNEAKSIGATAMLVCADVAVAAEVSRMVAEVEAALGGVDILVNNAGIFPRVKFLDMCESDWDAVFDVNLRGAFLCAQAVARNMVASGVRGAIVNISSGAIRGKRLGVHYAASKAGLIGMTRSMALELAPYGIRVNAVAPGLTDTAQPRLEHDELGLQRLIADIPLGRIGQPADIADPILFLASDEARFITGQTLYVNGGTYMR